LNENHPGNGFVGVFILIERWYILTEIIIVLPN